MKTTLLSILAGMILSGAITAQTGSVKLQSEVQSFIGKDSKAIAIESADLNGDGLKDHVLLLAKSDPEFEAANTNMKRGAVLILIRGKDRKLTEAGRNENFVWSGFYTKLKAARNTFTIFQEGGNFNRWNESLKFNYSRIDQTWELVRRENEFYQATGPRKTEREIKTPKNFGKIRIADFDPSVFEESSNDQNSLTEEELKELLPEGYRTIHEVVAGDFGGWNSGGQNKPEADSRTKFVMLISNQTPADKYKAKVIVPAGFEAFDTFDLPEPQNTWAIMEPLAVFF
ncbi:MAG: hypothetical protein R2681_08255 [Pyrinomonadaceae bacterium]